MKTQFWSSICTHQQASVLLILSADVCSRPVKLRQIKSQWKIKEPWEYSTPEGQRGWNSYWPLWKKVGWFSEIWLDVENPLKGGRVDKLISKQNYVSAFTWAETNAFTSLQVKFFCMCDWGLEVVIPLKVHSCVKQAVMYFSPASQLSCAVHQQSVNALSLVLCRAE